MEKYKGAGEKSKKLGVVFQKVAEKCDCKFIDIAKYVKPSAVDGYHLDQVSHQKVAETLFTKIKRIF
jgi:hypothetical protein